MPTVEECLDFPLTVQRAGHIVVTNYCVRLRASEQITARVVTNK